MCSASSCSGRRSAPLLIHIIDDDEAVRTSLVFALQAVGYRVASHVSAHDFLALEQTERGVVICDVRMPGMDGVELTRRLRPRGASAAVILITGNANRTLTAEAIAAGAAAVLEKPVALQALVAAIAKVSADWA